jgi:hypothetical protein
MEENQESFLFVFSFFLFFNLAVFCDILSLNLGGNLLVLLVLFFKSVLGGLVGVVPHFTDDFGNFGDFGIWIFSFDFAVIFLSE